MELVKPQVFGVAPQPHDQRPPMIFEAVIACMRDIDAISKDRKNAAQGYNFRGIDDVYNELHAVLAKHGVFTVSELLNERTEDRTSGKGSTLIYRVLTLRYTFFAADGSYVTTTVVGEGMDSGDKASNKAMAVGHKYALMQIFCIPTKEDKDPENARDDEKAEAREKQQSQAKSKPIVCFAGSSEQKIILKGIFDKHKVTEHDEMIRIAGLAMGKPMADLEAFVIKEL